MGSSPPAVSFTGGFRTPAIGAGAWCELSDQAGVRNPSQLLTHAPQQLYSITSSARASNVVGSVSPRDFAVYGDGVNVAARLEGIAEPAVRSLQ